MTCPVAPVLRVSRSARVAPDAGSPLALPLPLAFLALLVLPTLLLAAQMQDAGEDDPELRGRVLLQGDRALPGAVVELHPLPDSIRAADPADPADPDDPAGPTDPLRSAVTDADGNWTLPVPAGGRARLRVRHLATEDLELEVVLPESGSLHLEVEMERRPLRLPEMLVRAHPLPGGDASATRLLRSDPPGRARLDLERLTGGTGLVETGLAGRTGSADPGDPESRPREVLYMRGSTVDTRTIHLDGAPILTPFHLAGLLPSFDADMLGRAELHLGGAPAGVDGGLSYVLHVESREPAPLRTGGSVSVDGVAARMAVHTPLPAEGSLLVATRRVHNTLAGTSTGGTPYTFGDWLQRIAFSPAPGQRLRFTWFENAEGIRLDLPGFQAESEPRPVASRDHAPISEWGNRALSATWSLERGAHRLEAVVAGSRYHAGVPLAGRGQTLATTRSDRRRLAVEFHAPLPGSGSRSAARSELRAGITAQDNALRWALSGDAAPDPLRTEAHARARRLGVFAEARLPLTPDLHLRAGGRMDHFGGEDGWLASPRMAATWRPTDDVALTLSAGRYREHAPDPGLAPAPSSGEGGGESDTDPPLEWSPRVPVSTADHVVLSLDQALRDETTLSVSGFFKEFHPVSGPHAAAPPILSAGSDLSVHRRGERMEGWVGYTMSWFWEEGGPRPQAGGGGEGSRGTEGDGGGPGGPSGAEASRGFEGRHLLSAGLRTQLPMGLELSLTGSYGAGLPMAAVAPGTHGAEASWSPEGARFPSRVGLLSTDQEGGPLPTPRSTRFVRMDLEASWPTVREVGSRSWMIRPHVRVLNALNSRDALFHYFDRWADEGLRPVAERPFLPLVGVEVSF